MRYEKRFKKIVEKHEKIRKILMDAWSSEFWDAIIWDICEVFGYPDTNIYYTDGE